ncbi:hypothetical protein ABT288_40455 [Streptomyces sp. NPDC001093]|uniref:hypothetical protein n=1 Tax=Streptomyces sp. NPDC001093 TaxID=3154376 RepID=UPI00332D2164
MRGPTRLKASSSSGCGWSPYRPSGTHQRVRHIGRSLPSASFTFRWQNRMYLSIFAASSGADS